MTVSLFLRKRRVLLAIFLLSLTYCVVKTYNQLKKRVAVEEEEDIPNANIEEILRTVKPYKPSVNSGVRVEKQDQGHIGGHRDLFEQDSIVEKAYSCKNSVQGRLFIADDKGYLCDRFDLQSNGCCSVAAKSTKRYTCDSCNESGCCSSYEACVSCCLHPQKVSQHLVCLHWH